MNIPPAKQKLDILIAGAGIGGMSAAIALGLSGHRVRIFERVTMMGEVGAGLQVSANAGHVYAALGMGDDLIDMSVPPDRWVVRLGKTGETLTAWRIRWWRQTWPGRIRTACCVYQSMRRN